MYNAFVRAEFTKENGGAKTVALYLRVHNATDSRLPGKIGLITGT